MTTKDVIARALYDIECGWIRAAIGDHAPAWYERQLARDYDDLDASDHARYEAAADAVLAAIAPDYGAVEWRDDVDTRAAGG